ncbi:hypothetical protein [Pseudotabrizicola sp. 4114]|uniref:hypothetical protein n=1 Tax=Pseudotabrizicola sp. 4114 TaxID=2817731 RepID=UPI002866C8C1|nr:hypothetical protein [Pseudorhodobacter sp. 4114]
MFNPLPLLALGAVAVGYAGAIDRVDQSFDLTLAPTVAAYTATPDLSVHDFVGKLPESVQDPLCDTKEVITVSLTDDFAETLEGQWVQEQSVNVELWTSDLMGTWTLLQVKGDGLTCIVSSGFGWTEEMTAESIVQNRPIS